MDANVKGFIRGDMPSVGDEICTEDPASATNSPKSYETFSALVVVQDHA